MKTSYAPSLTKIMSDSFATSLRVGLISSVMTITLCCVAPSHAAAQTLLTDSYLNPNAPASGAELNDNLANRQTGSLATVGYSSSTLNSGGASGFAYLNESSNLEILSAVGAFANVWTTTDFSTSAQTTISVDLWPTVTQNPGSGFASLLVGGGLNNTKSNDGVIWAGGAANAITVTLYGNGTLTIRDQSKFDGADGEYIYWRAGAFTNNGFKNLKIVTSAFASGSQSMSFYLDNTAVLSNYTRAAGFTSDNYIGFQAYRNEGATQSVFDNLSVTVTPDYTSWATDNAGGQAANFDWDNDGVSNGVEFFMNAAPGFTANPGLVGNTVTWPNGGNISASTYGTQFVVQTSSDLVTWNEVAEGDLNNTAGSLSYSVDPANAPAKQFVRLKVTPN